MSILIGLAALAQAAQAPAATIEPAGTPQFELQCMVAANQSISQQTEQQAALNLQVLSLFFSGRVEQVYRDDAQLSAAVAASVDAMAGRVLNPVTTACAQYMTQRLARFQRLAEAAKGQ